MIKPLITALRTLTILPIPGKETKNISHSLPFFPLVGLFLGAVVYALIKLAVFAGIGQSSIIALVSLIAVTVVTGALHIDGLGDVADGFGSRKNKAEILAIFKDSRLGTFGVCAVVFDLLLKLVCWNELIQTNRFLIIIISFIISRSMQSIFLCFVPSARENSLVSSFNKIPIAIKIIILLSSILHITLGGYFAGYFAVALYFFVAFIVSLFFALYCIKKIGGFTGDCVGALNELSEIAVVLCGTIF